MILRALMNTGPDLINITFRASVFALAHCAIIVLTDTHLAAHSTSVRETCATATPTDVHICVCVHFQFPLTGRNIITWRVCIKQKPLSNKAADWFRRVSWKMFYISWPLLIIWLYKFQFPALKGHTGRLEALVFTWLWNSRYLCGTIDRTWQMYASCQLVILPVWDESLQWPLQFLAMVVPMA